MIDTDDGAATLVAYEIAVAALPPLTRVIFLRHRVDELPYDDIAKRLSISISAVECCVAEALFIIVTVLDGETLRRRRRTPILEAEIELRRRYRCDCEGRSRRWWWVRAIRKIGLDSMSFEEWLVDRVQR